MKTLLLFLTAGASLPAFAQDLPSEAAPELPAETSYALAASKSDLYVVIRNDTDATLARMGHDHVIYASKFTGTVRWPNTPDGSCAIDIQVPASGLVVDPPGLREKAGLDENTIDDSDKEKLSKNMWGRSQLDADAHPTIRFQGSKCSGTSGKVQVDGTLNVRGTDLPLTVTMDVSADGSSFSATGRFETTHTALGFKPFAATMLGPRNQDRLSFVVRVKGNAK